MPSNSFLEQLDKHWYKPWGELRAHISLVATSSEKWQTLIPLFEQISAQNVFIMIWNVMTNHIVYTTDKRKVCDYASKYLAENGMEFSLANMHADALYSVFMMNQQGMNFFAGKKGNETNKVLANLDGVYKRYTGEYFHFLQQSVCMEYNDEGYPILFLSYLYDISYLKKAKTANLIITVSDEIKWWNFNFDKNCLEPVQPLSKQEKKILAYLAEGKSSKEIANELSLSSHTIDTHRRNLLEKTNCIDTTGMITYARLVGLI